MQEVLDLRAITIGSEEILVILEVHFRDGIRAETIESTTDAIKAELIEKIDSVKQVQIEAETPDEELNGD